MYKRPKVAHVLIHLEFFEGNGDIELETEMKIKHKCQPARLTNGEEINKIFRTLSTLTLRLNRTMLRRNESRIEF